jgi:site-specific DNA-cytosine methylase
MLDFQTYQAQLPDGTDIVRKNVAHIIKKHSMGMNARINYRVLGLDKEYVYAVIGEMMGRQVHPTEDRIMNIREFIHLMGLPHDYELEGQKEFVKITQNVPVSTCIDMTSEVVEIINGNRLLYNNSVNMQDNSKESTINKSDPLF